MEETSYLLSSPANARALREHLVRLEGNVAESKELASDATSFASQHFDVVVVGGGFAGTAAAINLARANRNACLVDAGTPRNRNSEHMHGSPDQVSQALGSGATVAIAIDQHLFDQN